MNQSNIESVITYAATLINIPYRWYDEEVDTFNGTDKFWCDNSMAPLALDIILNDKSIICTGLINLLRRKCSLSIPGLNRNIFDIKNYIKNILVELVHCFYIYIKEKD